MASETNLLRSLGSYLGLCLVDRRLEGGDDLLGVLGAKDGCPSNDDIAACVCPFIEQVWGGLLGESDLPASAHTSIFFGPTPPSTSMSLSGKRALSSDTLGMQRSKNFCPPRPRNIPM
jgi:hypothetical protein